jgi:hypothetical protein
MPISRAFGANGFLSGITSKRKKNEGLSRKPAAFYSVLRDLSHFRAQSPNQAESRLATGEKTVHSPAPVRVAGAIPLISHVLENQKSRHHCPR